MGRLAQTRNYIVRGTGIMAIESPISPEWSSPAQRKLVQVLGRLKGHLDIPEILDIAHDIEAFLANYPGESYPVKAPEVQG